MTRWTEVLGVVLDCGENRPPVCEKVGVTSGCMSKRSQCKWGTAPALLRALLQTALRFWSFLFKKQGLKQPGEENGALFSLTAWCLLRRSPGVSARPVLGLKPKAKHPCYQDCLSNTSASLLGLESVSLQGT